ncbi:MAG TPA: hypothetical protein VG889_14035 [Rhizomicrobium sp.]|nr:hypothetical protein [Rhizomicrobium sp.]
MTPFSYKCRRFFVLEDNETDFERICELLKRLTSYYYEKRKLPEAPAFEIVRSVCTAPTPSAKTRYFAAPLELAAEDVTRKIFFRQKNGDWSSEVVPGGVGLVPWLTRKSAYPGEMLPHACILDIKTGPPKGQKSEQAFHQTRSVLRDCCYPSSAVWVFSLGELYNDDYGLFLPKEALDPIRPGEPLSPILQTLGNQLCFHGTGADDAPTRARRIIRTKESTYLPPDAEIFCEAIQEGVWNPVHRVQIHISDSLDPADREPLRSKWFVAESPVENPRSTIAFDNKPTVAPRVFTFFFQKLTGEEQSQYLGFRSFGLPAEQFLRNPVNKQLLDASEVLIRIAEAAKGRAFNAIIRMNCLVALELLVGATPMDKFNCAWPFLQFGKGTFRNIFNDLHESIEGSSASEPTAAKAGGAKNKTEAKVPRFPPWFKSKFGAESTS